MEGLVVMRAQPLHFGHTRLVDRALKECKTVYVVLGSCQEQGTPRNPFDYAERKSMLKRVYNQRTDEGGRAPWERMRILGLDDIFSLRWPAYVLEEIMKLHPDAKVSKVYGGSVYDTDWFKDQGLEGVVVDRTEAGEPFVSASMVRDMLEYRDPRWMSHVPECNWTRVARKFGRLDMLEERQ